jgi:predicted DNA-binding transcriptional regulator YafY
MEIIPQVLKLGSEAKLLEPASARKEMKKIVQTMNELY